MPFMFFRRILVSLWILLSLLALIQIGRLSVFMFDPSRTWGSTVPDQQAANHMCMAAYVQAADLARRGEKNIYDQRFYPAFWWHFGTEPPPISSPVAGLSKYLLDPFQYPPQFLLLPRVALALTNNFLSIRTVWYVLQLLTIIAACLLTARWIGGKEGRLIALLLPAMLASLPLMLNLQFGQFHAMSVILAIGSMIAFEKRKAALGGALLGFAILSKIFPVILLIYLAGRRQWKEIGWTAIFGAIFTIAGIAILGWPPFQVFLSFELPRLLNEQAFSFIRRTDIPLFLVSRNYSIHGLLTRFHFLGLTVPASLKAFFVWGYTLMLFGLAWWSGRFSGERSRLALLQLWIALLTLASLRTPLAPSSYVVVPTLFLLMLLAPEIQGRRKYGIAIVFLWIIIMGVPPLPDRPEVIFDFLSQSLLIAINLWVLLRHRSAAETVAQRFELQPA
jgi:alpha-1,2-mannosyltransferase